MDTTYHIGYAADSDLRFKASSGGIGTAIMRYLLSQTEYGTGITFHFNKEKCMYEATLIHSAEEINPCGSIYQDIDIPRFLRDNISNIKGGIVVSCTPCQVSPIRQLLSKNSIPHFIISFCCSGQTTIEGTWKYYELLGIRKSDVVNMQYRGNGWPSGIQIWLSDGSCIKRDNYTEPWTTLHLSLLYRPRKCFFCKLDTGRNADISLADPWLKDYEEHDQIGNTLFLANTEKGKQIVNLMQTEETIQTQLSSYDTYAIAQKNNIGKKARHETESRFSKFFLSFCMKGLYFQWASKNQINMQRHLKIIRILKKLLTSKTYLTFRQKA